jgi:hypothetical protein
MMNEQVPKTDHGPILGSGWIHLTSTVILGLGIFFAYQWWKNPLMHRIAMITLGVAVVPWVITLYRLYRLKRALGGAEFFIEQEGVPLGYSGTATYVRPLRDAEVREIEVRLQCEESVEKGRGKNRRDVVATTYDEVITPHTTPMMEQLQVRIPFKIPATGTHSMYYEEAKVTWWIRLRLKMRGCPNTRSSFKIEVYPAVVER